MSSPAGCLVIALAPLIVGAVAAGVIIVTGQAPRGVVKLGGSIGWFVTKVFVITLVVWCIHKAITLDKQLGAGHRR